MTTSGDGSTAAATPGAASGSRQHAWRSAVDLLSVVGPVGILTGLLYYLGFVGARAFYSYFGVSLSILDLSTTDYVANNASSLFQPVVALVSVMAVAFLAHHLLGRVLTRVGPERSRWVALGIGCVAGLLAVVGVLGLQRVLPAAMSAVALALAAAVLEYGCWTASRFAALPADVRIVVEAAVTLRRGILAAVVLVATFWAVTVNATERGRASARVFEQSLPLQPQAVVYAETDLHLPGPGVGSTVLSGGYGFRYNGLRQLLHANGRWFLLPVGWTHANGSTVIVLPDDHAGSRVDLAP